MIGKDSSEYYDENKEEEHISQIIKSDTTEIILYILWILFIFLFIPSIISVSMYYTTLKYPLDELRNTINNNHTFEDDVKQYQHFDNSKLYKCEKYTSVSDTNIKQQLMNGNIILLQSHKFITNGESARSEAGTFDFETDTFCLTNITENYVFVGYQSMHAGGVYVIRTRYNDIIENSDQFVGLVQVNQSFNLNNWKNGTEVKSLVNITDDQEKIYLNTQDVYKVKVNKDGKPYILESEKVYCITLMNTKDESTTTLCKPRVWIENRIYTTVNIPNNIPLIYLNYDDYLSMISLDIKLNAVLCTPKEKDQ